VKCVKVNRWSCPWYLLSTTPWRCTGKSFLTSALDGGEWSASRPDHFTPGERVPGTHWTGVWVGLRASVDAKVNKSFLPLPVTETRSSSLYSVTMAYWLSYSGSKWRAHWTQAVFKNSYTEVGPHSSSAPLPVMKPTERRYRRRSHKGKSWIPRQFWILYKTVWIKSLIPICFSHVTYTLPMYVENCS
jgi:hypothetical protein